MNEVASFPGVSREEHEQLQKARWRLLLLGAASFLLGLIAISSTFIATMATVTVLGFIILFAGITEVVHAVLVRNWRGFGLHLLAAAMYLIVGLFILEDRVRAATVLTLILAASFIVGGLLRVIFSLIERYPSSVWVTVSGFVDLLLGIMIINRWPSVSLWVIGLFVGLDLLFHGWSSIMLGLTLSRSNVPLGVAPRPSL
jgi:uncharacterized membrane protein HdeD (DUF308 family)